MDEWNPALRKLREGHYLENSMSKGRAKKNRKWRCPVDRPKKRDAVLIQDCQGLQMSSYRLWVYPTVNAIPPAIFKH